MEISAVLFSRVSPRKILLARNQGVRGTKAWSFRWSWWGEGDTRLAGPPSSGCWFTKHWQKSQNHHKPQNSPSSELESNLAFFLGPNFFLGLWWVNIYLDGWTWIQKATGTYFVCWDATTEYVALTQSHIYMRVITYDIQSTNVACNGDSSLLCLFLCEQEEHVDHWTVNIRFFSELILPGNMCGSTAFLFPFQQTGNI